MNKKESKAEKYAFNYGIEIKSCFYSFTYL